MSITKDRVFTSKKNAVFVIFTIISLLSFIFATLFSSSASNAESINSDFEVKVDSVLEMSLINCDGTNNSVVAVNITPSTNGAFRSNCQTVTINTNNPGYTLSVKSSSVDLIYQNPNTLNIQPTIQSTSNEIANVLTPPSTLDTDTWGFAVEGNTALGFDTTYTVDNSNNKFAQLSTVDTTIFQVEDTWPLQKNSHKFFYGAKLTTDTMAGEYTTIITYTAIGQEPADVVNCNPHTLEYITNPLFYTWEQGTLDGTTGQDRDYPSDLANRFRLADYVAVDPSWTDLKISAFAPFTGGSMFIGLFSFDSSYNFLSNQANYTGHASFALPEGTAYIKYLIGNNSGAIVAGDYEGKITVSAYTSGTCEELEEYTLISQEITPNHDSTNTTNGLQGANFVNGDFWHASPSTDGHATTDGNVRIYSVNWDTYTITQTHLFHHNFGHLNSFSYDSSNNNLVFGNGSGSYTQTPEFFVVKVSNIDLDSTNTLDSVSATRFAVPNSFGAKCNVIWTDTADVAIMITNDATDIYKIRLAKGAEQLQYGNYSIVASDEYNGTWEVLSAHYIKNSYEVLQGAAYIDGKILAGFGHGPIAIGVIELLDEGVMDYKVWEDTSKSMSMATVWYDNLTGRYGAVWTLNGARMRIWDSLPFTFTDN